MSKAGYQTRIKMRIAELRDAISAAQTELAELEVAERVLDRLGGGTGSGEQEKAPVVASHPKPTRGGDTVADRAIAVLRDQGPMTSADLLSELRGTWRADLAQTTLSSTLSRISKNGGQVVNEGGIWSAVESKPDVEGDDEDLLGLLDLDSATGEGTANDTPAADVFE